MAAFSAILLEFQANYSRFYFQFFQISDEGGVNWISSLTKLLMTTLTFLHIWGRVLQAMHLFVTIYLRFSTFVATTKNVL